MSENTDHLYIIYQGHAEQWRWRQVDAEGATVRKEDGQPNHSEIFFRDPDSAREDLLKIDPDAQIDQHRAANFAETIDDAEEREEQDRDN